MQIYNNLNLISESVIMGFITYILGIVIFYLTFKNKKDDDKPKGLEIVFFITGVVLHIFIEIIGFSKC